MWVLLLVLTMLVMIYFRTKRRSFIPSLPTCPGFTLPFIGGHSITLLRNGGDICQALREEWSGGPISYFNLLGPKVLINDPKLQLEVLNGKNFTKGGNGNVFSEVFGNGLAAQINVEMHARQRAVLRPFFVKSSIDAEIEFVDELINKQINLRGQHLSNLSEMCREAAFVVLYRMVFDRSSDDEHFNYLLKCMRILNEKFVFAGLEKEIQNSLPFGLGRFFPTWNLDAAKEQSRNIQNFGTKILADESFVLPDILRALKDSSVYQERVGFAEEEILMLFFAGVDTTSIALQRVIFLLAEHPNVRSWLLEVIKTHFDGISSVNSPGPLGRALEATLKESMRFEPPVALNVRFSLNECTLMGHPIPKDTDVFLNLTGLLRNKEIWGQDADQFRPSRLLENDAALLDSRYFQVFGAGRRACLGQHLSMLEQRVFLVRFLQAFPGYQIVGSNYHSRHGVTNAFNKDLIVQTQ